MFQEWLQRGLKKPGKSQIGLAKFLDQAPSVVSRMVTGKRPLRGGEIERISLYLDEPPPFSRAESRVGTSRLIPVLAVALEGAWREDPEALKPSVPYVFGVRRSNRDERQKYAIEISRLQAAATVEADFAVCVPLSELRRAIRADDMLHVVRSRGGLQQILVRMVQKEGDALNLIALDGGGEPLPVNEVEVRGVVSERLTCLRIWS